MTWNKVTVKLIYDKGTGLQRFLSTFSKNKEAFAVSQNTLDKRLRVLLKNFKKWHRESKAKYLDHFSSSAWKSLSALQKGLHSILNCRECHVNHLLFQMQFPLKTNRLKGLTLYIHTYVHKIYFFSNLRVAI